MILYRRILRLEFREIQEGSGSLSFYVRELVALSFSSCRLLLLSLRLEGMRGKSLVHW